MDKSAAEKIAYIHYGDYPTDIGYTSLVADIQRAIDDAVEDALIAKSRAYCNTCVYQNKERGWCDNEECEGDYQPNPGDRPSKWTQAPAGKED